MADEVSAGTPNEPAPPATSGGAQGGAAAAATGGNLDFVLDVPLKVTVEVGSARMLVRDVLQLNKGSVVELDRMAGEPADVYVNERLVARGEVTVIDDRLAVRVVEVVGADADRPLRV